MRIDLPGGPYTLSEPVTWPAGGGPAAGRVVYAAAHVVADPLGDNTPGAPAAVDWEATLRFRRHLWSYGLRVADAMDTAQRNMGLDWAATRELIRRSAAEAATLGDPAELVACGAGTDHAPGADDLDAIVAAYAEQVETVQETGAGVIVMASRQLARVAAGPKDYHRVYGKLFGLADRPVILHWLGEMFDPQLPGYWGSRDVAAATESFLELVHAHAAMVDGVKVSLLDEEHEVRLRAALPAGVRLYTGDDFNYPSLIRTGSHALLGIFDAIAPAAAAALRALDAAEVAPAGPDRDRLLASYEEILAPTVPLSRKIFETPTFHYKTGIVFLAWLNGHQDAFAMVNGAQSARSLPHLAEVFRLADRAGLLADQELAVRRMRALLEVSGL
ncbi:dihydrodipicolinate synthase family protein [Nonomuraea ferruginea]|uniref:Dihydrodipicolinate synthase family protein n=1 Tax=Nonomuraea ferruginea TaxID=46174 RepID=A0ABT4T8H7_9ACTN|nr:dihydrodipicolinate synthase family protein [Nonomuraea ferruginea]MDA0645819.1 dihydrodipicolinate synthase family protein [Nonomuraea ferruginea]